MQHSLFPLPGSCDILIFEFYASTPPESKAMKGDQYEPTKKAFWLNLGKRGQGNYAPCQ